MAPVLRHRPHQGTTLVTMAIFALLVGPAGNARGQGGCGWDIPEVSPCAELELQFDRRFTGTYRTGEPFDMLTILPDGTGDTLEGMGIHLRLRVRCCFFDQQLDPAAGIPAEEIVLWSSGLCLQAPLHADHPTDTEGYTEFSGTLAGGGCAEALQLFIDGVFVATVPIRINSPDTGAASPCHVDQSDLGTFAARLGVPSQYDVCSDFNESGTIDASDLSFFAAALGLATR